MNATQARMCSVGTRVRLIADPLTTGEVIRQRFFGLTIQWDAGPLEKCLHREMMEYERVPEPDGNDGKSDRARG